MIIILWLFTIVTFLTLVLILIKIMLHDRSFKMSLNQILTPIKDGFKEGLKGCGFVFSKSGNIVELYHWVTSEDEDVCEECQQKAHMKPMDIPDWMKEGLPGTPEARTLCEENCRCKLVLVKTVSTVSKYGNPKDLICI